MKQHETSVLDCHVTFCMSLVMCVFCLPVGSLLDFLKSDEGNRLLLPKLIDFSAQVRFKSVE